MIIFLIFYPILQVKYFLDWMLSNVIYLRKGNFFFKNFLINKPFVKKVTYKDTNIKVLINSFYDVWRIGGYKNFFLDDLFEDAKKEKIYYYDIGANTGFSTIIASKKLSERIQSFAIELEPANFKSLNDNILVNKLKNISIINLGLSGENKSNRFFYNKINTIEKNFFYPLSSIGLHSTKFSKDLHSQDLSFNALMLKFDDLLENFKLPEPTHIFIDAFGSEKDIITGMEKVLKSKSIKKIYLDIEDECNDLKDTWIFDYLSKKGFISDLILEKKHKYAKNNWNVVFKRND